MISSPPRELLFLDTCVLIYFLEGKDEFGPAAKKLLEKVEKGFLTAFISTLTLTELLTGPYRVKNDLLALEYHALLFHFPHLNLVDINVDIAVEAARIRGTYNYSTPDSLLLSAALQVKAAAFITTDRKLLGFPELPVLHLIERIFNNGE
jgi:predicted nucleic acid-binding protein